jgi:hypothetical protein
MSVLSLATTSLRKAAPQVRSTRTCRLLILTWMSRSAAYLLQRPGVTWSTGPGTALSFRPPCQRDLRDRNKIGLMAMLYTGRCDWHALLGLRWRGVRSRPATGCIAHPSARDCCILQRSSRSIKRMDINACVYNVPSRARLAPYAAPSGRQSADLAPSAAAIPPDSAGRASDRERPSSGSHDCNSFRYHLVTESLVRRLPGVATHWHVSYSARACWTRTATDPCSPAVQRAVASRAAVEFYGPDRAKWLGPYSEGARSPRCAPSCCDLAFTLQRCHCRQPSPPCDTVLSCHLHRRVTFHLPS